MNDSTPPHAPRERHPDDTATLGHGARVRDVSAGASMTADEWIAQCSSREGRPEAECREALMNAIARGDVVVEDSGAD